MSMTETLRLVIGGDPKGGVAALKAVGAQSKSTAGSMKSSFSGMSTAVSAGLLAVGTAAAAYAKKSLETWKSYGKDVKAVMRSTGGSAEEASTIVGQIKLVAGSTTDVSQALGRWSVNLAKARQEGTDQARIMSDLGVEMKDANGNWRDGAAVLLDYRDSISNMSDATARSYDLQAMLGRGYKTTMAYFTKSTTEMADATKFLKDNSLILSDKDMATWAELMGNEKKLAMVNVAIQMNMGKLVGQIENEVMPTVIGLMELVNKVPPDVWLVVGAIAGVSGAMRILQPFYGPVKRLFGLFSGASSAVRVAATEAESTAIGTQTAAIEANTIARATNARFVGSASGVIADARWSVASKSGVASTALGTTVPGVVGTGTAGLGTKAAATGAGGAAVSGTVASLAITAAALAGGASAYYAGYKPYKEALQQQADSIDVYVGNVESSLARLSRKYGSESNRVAEYVGIVNEDLLTQFEDTHENWATRYADWASFGVLDIDMTGLGAADKQAKSAVEQIQQLLAAGPVAAGSKTEDQLRKLYQQLVNVKNPSDAVKASLGSIKAELETLDPGALLSVADAADAAAEAAEEAAAELQEIKDSITSDAVSVQDAMLQALEKGVQFTSQELLKIMQDTEEESAKIAAAIDAQMHPESYKWSKKKQTWVQTAAISATHDRTGQVGMQYPGAAKGAFIPRSPGGTLLRVGEGRYDEVVAQVIRGKGTAASSMSFDGMFRNCHFSAQSPTELADKVSDTVMNRVLEKIQGVNLG